MRVIALKTPGPSVARHTAASSSSESTRSRSVVGVTGISANGFVVSVPRLIAHP